MSEVFQASAPQTFPSGTQFYITAVNGGACIEPLANGLCVQKFYKEDPNQYWAAEYRGSSPNEICFKHVKTGKYMRSTGAAASSRIALADQPSARTWWTPRPGRAPGTFCMKATEFPDAWLCNQSASWNENAATYVYPYSLGWSHALAWYLMVAPGFTPEPIEAPEEIQAKKTVKQEIEAMEGERERLKQQVDEKKKEMEQLEAQRGDSGAALKKREEEIAAREKAVEERQQQLALAASENEKLKKEAEELKAKSATNNGSDSSAAKVTQLEKENETLKKQLESLNSSGNSASSDADRNTVAELDKLRAENEELKKQIHDSQWATTAPDASAKAVAQQSHGGTGRQGADSNGNGSSDAETEDIAFSQLQEENEDLRAQLIVAKRQACHFHHPKMQVRKMPPVKMTWK
ncbi:hypothetical protein K431DRAFT_307589 [Polychaeton citri CBS 116435]|uniref:Uncharacterized protein n=1 Tax=Polychaeton citri CBS 116435 TaxID=1314669 RepID=A0A9P4UJS1_9PEZI|nr:hypothetical protein K431DRAFT_307589 [Polychaeton citri CBS 116435]